MTPPRATTATQNTDVDETGSPLLDAGGWGFYIGLAVVVLSVVSALATYLILTGLTPIAPRDDVVVSALFINVVLLVVMFAVIAWQAFGLWRAWRAKIPGARLHIRIIALFSITAALPAILLAIAATTTFARALESRFTARTQAIIESSVDVAKAYLAEHGQVIRNDIVNMARDLDAAADTVEGDSPRLERLALAQANLRDLPSAYIIDEKGAPALRALEDAALPYQAPPAWALQEAEAGQTPVLTPPYDFRIAALAKLQRYPGRYLYVARGVSAKVMGHLQRTEQNATEYGLLRRAQGGLVLAHGLLFGTISMTALLAALWTGLWFASRFVAPIRRLIAAARNVSQGNLNLELPERQSEGDLMRLSQTFNTMTRELKHQRDSLVTANEQLFERRRFMEAVLSGVSAGVIGLDAQGRITIANRSARTLLGDQESDFVGKKLEQAVPAFAGVQERKDHRKSRPQKQVTVTVGGDERFFAVRSTREKAGEGDGGSVVTFDDITDLVSAQRTSAWADVARRIAHEIKNPLTPIILSAERIRRKYGKVITEDRETFDKLTATIERQAGDIKSLVEEFSSFARVPKPTMEPSDLREAIQDPVILFRESHPNITYEMHMPAEKTIGSFDRRLMTQALTNLVKNATEAVEAAAETSGEGWRGRIEAVLRQTGDGFEIEVIDNGIGFPKQNRNRLLEPYVTTRTKGTGLGLAIVQKIIVEHGGTLTLEDAPKAPGRSRGALVRVTLPLAAQARGPGRQTTPWEGAPSAPRE